MKPKPVEVTLSPVDNQRLATLCGAFDENLRQIEIALDIVISRRENIMKLHELSLMTLSPEKKTRFEEMLKSYRS